MLLVNTGCRRSEAISLRWSNIDLNNGFAVIEKDKRHREKVITLNAEVVELLKTLPRHAEDDRVFFWIPSDNAVTVAFPGAVKRAGIVNFRLHDLRHTAASHLAMAGHDIKTIQEFLGHNDIRQTTLRPHLKAHAEERKRFTEREVFSEGYSDQGGMREWLSALAFPLTL